MCPINIERDERLQLDSKRFNEITVYNIFTLEELSIRDFLVGGECNIILKTGERHYGFERNELIQFMATRRVYIRLIENYAYETPFNQCITTDAFIHLKYADYTIYELEKGFTEIVDGVIKSLFTCKCYSVEQWAVGDDSEHYNSRQSNAIKVLRFVPLSYELLLEKIDFNSYSRHSLQIALTIGIGAILGHIIPNIGNWYILILYVYIFINLGTLSVFLPINFNLLSVLCISISVYCISMSLLYIIYNI